MGILLTIAYDGTDYCGWQQQKNGLSVHAVLENAIAPLLGAGQGFSLLGASRTDAGVHALGQRVHLIASVPCPLPLHKMPLALNSRLPADVRVLAASQVPDAFHPINDAKSKTYSYRIYNARYQNPLSRRYTAFVPTPLDVEQMARAAQFFLGEHDFAAFCASGSSVKSTVRRIYELSVTKDGPVVEIIARGNGFLYNMVRIIAGTLTDVGAGKLAPQAIPEIIAGQKRTGAGKTMPPQGLVLIEVFYD